MNNPSMAALEDNSVLSLSSPQLLVTPLDNQSFMSLSLSMTECLGLYTDNHGRSEFMSVMAVSFH